MQGKYFIKKHISNRPRERCSLLNNTSFKMVASWHGIVTKKRNIKHTSMITLFFYGRILNYMKRLFPIGNFNVVERSNDCCLSECRESISSKNIYPTGQESDAVY